VPVQDFLNQRAVNVTVDGNYTLPNWYDPQGKLRTFACRTTRVSPFRMIVEVPVVGRVGDRLTSYFRDFGKFEGLISDTMERSFLLELEMTRARREKLSDMLIWLEKKQKNPAIKCVRKDARFVPPNPHSTLTLADGSVHPCFVIDVSATGIAVSSPVQPPIGMPLAVGACIGRVVRLLPNGIAIKFIERQNSRSLERLTARVGQTEAPADSGLPEPATSGDFVAV
jgi:PilZ domain-containing protein